MLPFDNPESTGLDGNREGPGDDGEDGPRSSPRQVESLVQEVREVLADPEVRAMFKDMERKTEVPRRLAFVPAQVRWRERGEREHRIPSGLWLADWNHGQRTMYIALHRIAAPLVRCQCSLT